MENTQLHVFDLRRFIDLNLPLLNILPPVLMGDLHLKHPASTVLSMMCACIYRQMETCGYDISFATGGGGVTFLKKVMTSRLSYISN